MQSNSVGRSIVSILKRDPRRYGEVASRLHGRQLPSTLRMYLWLDMLLRQERERLREGCVTCVYAVYLFLLLYIWRYIGCIPLS